MEGPHVPPVVPEPTLPPDACLLGGEMGARICAFDWSTTPLGPVEGWPQSLKTAVQILLNSRYPMFVWWGPTFTNLYNDAYAPMLGRRHPQALGQSAPVIWADVWDVVGPQAEAVLYEGRSSWNEELLLIMERYGYPEETYFTFSYSPITNDTGGVGGVFCAVTEDTARVLGQRRLHTLQELAALTAPARNAEEACRLAAEAIAKNSHDVPFALMYLLEPTGQQARLASAVGMEAGTLGAPACIDVAPEEPWPLGKVIGSGEPVLVEKLVERIGVISGGPWPDAPTRAVVLPLTQAGQPQQAGFLVAGVSPRRPLDDDYRGFLGLLAGQVATAISNARAYEIERQRAEALAELDRAKTLFFTNISHEFRTPLTLMLGPLEDVLTKPEGEVQPEDRALLNVVHHNGLRLLKLVNTLLDFSRIEAGRMQAVYEPTDIATFTSDLASQFRSAVERAGMRLIVNCPTIEASVYLDRDMWEKIVLNLLSNAFKFTFEGEIEVRLRHVGESVELTVRDTGVGIPAKEVPFVFERFHRVEGGKRRSHEGTGIGLALVYELVKLHGGGVRVDSIEGRGTTFTVSIPTGAAHLPADRIGATRTLSATSLGPNLFVEEALGWLPGDESARLASVAFTGGMDTPTTAPPHANDGSRPRIVLADDNADMREYVRRLLGREFAVEAVANGRAALDAIRRRLPELVLMDIMMPELDGLGLLQQIRADPDLRGLPVILLSARVGEEASVEGLQAGADDYLTKPFSARELVARVRTHIDMARVRRQAAEEIARQREDLYAFIRQSPVPMSVLSGPDLIYEMANAAYVSVAGGRDILGKPLLDILPEFSGQGYDGLLRDVIRTGEPVVGKEVRLMLEREGRLQETYWTFIYAPLRDPAGRIDRVVALCDEVTEQKRQTEQLRLLWEAAAVLLTATAPDAMLRELFAKIAPQFGLDTYFNYVLNDRGDRLQLVSCAGISAETAHTIEQLDFGQAVCGTVALQRRPIVATHIQQSDDPKVQLVKSFGIQAYACNPLMSEGRLLGTLSFASRTRAQFDAAELVFLETISHYVTVAYERLRLLEQLRQADRRKDEFLATLAHELRTPLVPIRNAAYIVRLKSPPDPELHWGVEVIERQLQQMTRLIDDLLDVSRITRDQLTLRPARLDLREVLQAAVETSRPLIEASGQAFVVTLPPEPIALDADPVRLAQVIANLLNNAAKYTERGGNISLSAACQGSEAVVTVRDTGVGIPAEMLPHIFEMFMQGEPPLDQTQGGLGIGLTLVKRIVELHGGSVAVHSDGPGTGSTFSIRLPVVRDAVATRPHAGPASERTVQAAARRILVVEDERISAASLERLLRLKGHDVRTAYDGLEALAAADAFRPDVVLLDIGLPEMTGYEVAHRIRQQPWGQTMVLIALTGWGQEADRQRSTQAGFDHHLVKPVAPAALLYLLTSL